jgi:hypothetical protein
VTRAAEEPRPVFLASFREVPKGMNLLLDVFVVGVAEEEVEVEVEDGAE